MVKVITEDEFNEVKEAAVALVDFYADWCGPCKMMGPVLEELSGEYDGKVSFFKIDVDEAQELAAEYQVSSIPNLVLFKNGDKVSDSIGFKPADDLKAWIEANI
jgi:thioredoxin